MAKLFIEELNVNKKKVLMRVDFNVPLARIDNALNVADPTRIEASIPSIEYILNNGGALILMSHLGRPHDQVESELSLAPVAKVLASMLKKKVIMAPDCVGPKVQEKIKTLSAGEIILLENLRFHRAEEHPEEDPFFAEELASYGECYVNDAFGTAHRKHSSTYFVPKYFQDKAAAGYLLEKEMTFLSNMLLSPQRPFYALLGGAKVSTKIGVIHSLLKKVDKLIIAGGMAYTFLRAKKIAIGHSLVEEDLVPLASEILTDHTDKIILPVDCLAAKECAEDASADVIKISQGIKSGYRGLDIGPETVDLFKQALSQAKTVLWNGPFGVYEINQFAQGTFAIAHYLAQTTATKIVGGGDLIAAIRKAGVINQMTHVSTGGGATLEYIEHGTLPGIEALSETG